MNGQPLPSSGFFGTCSTVAKTCSQSDGKTTNRNRSGYSPRCAHEWQRGVCGKPKVRCGECANQAFVALDDRQLLAHLQGRQVIGIYPLLPDDRCWLLAIDLDGGSWRADVQALARTCRSLGLHPAVERSRSGNGAHIWFFFTDPVPAAEARRLGFSILTATMAHGVALGVDSYDRLFPSQDMLPSGGFGNLIALPFNVQPATRATPNSSTTSSSPIAINGPTSRRSHGPRRNAWLKSSPAAATTMSSPCGRPRIRATHHGARHVPCESG